MPAAAHCIESRVDRIKQFDLFACEQAGIANLRDGGHRAIERQRNLVRNEHECRKRFALNVEISGKQFNGFDKIP
jgi:hypothetical protein